jgi:hypothetical protein
VFEDRFCGVEESNTFFFTFAVQSAACAIVQFVERVVATWL